MATALTGLLPIRTFTASGTITIHDTVKITAENTVAQSTAVTDTIIGFAQAGATDGKPIPIALIGPTVKARALGAIAVALQVKGGAGGEIDLAGNGEQILGVSLQAATAANDVIEIMITHSVPEDVSDMGGA